MMIGKKESQFTRKTTIIDSDFVRMFVPGQNLAISFSDFKLSLGVTGTLTATGDPLGVPVLSEPSPGDFQIRAIESGAGILASVSAQNGIKVKTNFAQGASGVELIKDLNADQQLFRSLVAGGGINISSTGDAIQITAVDAVVSTKTVIISIEADFPSPIAGVITLVADTQYLLIQDITTTNRFVMQEATTIAGTESLNITFTYTGVDDMFTGVNVTNRISKLSIDCPNGRIVNWSTNVFKIFRMNDISIVSCDKIALINSSGALGVCRFTNVSPAEVTTDGIELTGNWNSFLHEISAASITGGAYFNLGTATFNSIIIDLPLTALAVGTVLVSGASGSANINAGGIGIVTRAITSGLGSPLSGVSVNDALWNFSGNNEIADTRPDALLSMQGNATNTVISSSGTPVLVAGVWVVESTSQMTGTTGGRVTYNGGKDSKLPITASVTVSPVSGGTIEMSAEIAINGTVIPGSKRTASAASGGSSSITIPWQFNFESGDFVEVFVTNEDSTTNLLVSSATFRVN
jgi:hypothetical protein